MSLATAVESFSENKINSRQRSESDDRDNAKIFPQRLMEILSEEENLDAIRWLPHGKAFVIVNRQKFSQKILPRYFKKTKWASFTRKLNRWNFSRVAKGPELGAYYHEFFQRGNETLCTQMYCKNDRAKFAVGRDSSRGAQDTKKEVGVSPQSLMRPTPNITPLIASYPTAGSSTNMLVPGLLTSRAMLKANTPMIISPMVAQARILLAESRKRQESMVTEDKAKAILDSALLVLKRSKELELNSSLQKVSFVPMESDDPTLNRKTSEKLFGHAFAA